MARTFTLPFEAPQADIPSTGGCDRDSTNDRPVLAFDSTTDESCILEGIVPAEFTGSGTLKLTLHAMANTTTAADDARIDVVTEFLTPGEGESGNSDAFDATADSGTFTFSTTAYSEQALTITLTPATTPAAGDRFRIKITRDADHATLDSLAVDLLLQGVEFYEES